LVSNMIASLADTGSPDTAMLGQKCQKKIALEQFRF
jgi:hypothetical protein